jgi:hypothetical protein
MLTANMSTAIRVFSVLAGRPISEQFHDTSQRDEVERELSPPPPS